MSRLVRRLFRPVCAGIATVLGCLLPAVLLPVTAFASDAVTVTHVTAHAVTATATVAGLSTGHLSASDLVASLDRQSVPVTVRSQASRSVRFNQQRAVVLLLDTSGSMHGTPLHAAVAAARSFVDDLPSDVAVGVVTFDHRVHLVVAPTTDHDVASAALANIKAGGDTSLYDGVLAASRLLGHTGDRRIVLLSDGGDSASGARLAAAAGSLGGRGPSLTAIAFGRSGSGRHALRVLADAGAGHVITASGAPALAHAFDLAAQQFTTRLSVSISVPVALRGHQVHLALSVPTVRGPVILRAVARVPSASATRPRLTAPHADQRLLYAGLVGVGVGLLLVAAIAWGAREQSHGRAAQTRRLISRYTLAGRSAPAQDESNVLGASRITRTAVELAGRAIRRRDYEERIALRLDRAGVSLRPAEWVLAQAALITSTLLIGIVLSHNVLVAALLTLVLGAAGPRLILSVRISRRRNAFQLQLPDALTVVAGSLGAGYSLAQALDTVVREGAQPFAGEISRALAASRIGIPLEDALDEVAERMAVRDFAWVVMAVRTQREVGGNLSEILRTVASTMRERAQLRRQVRSLSAEGRLSAYILIGLPILMAAYEFGFRREYMRPLYTSGIGIAMLGAAILLVLVGAVWMTKLVKVEV